jgi:hypothetical protein
VATDLVQQPGFAEGTPAAQKIVLERADPLTDRAIEAAHLADMGRMHSLTLVR